MRTRPRRARPLLTLASATAVALVVVAVAEANVTATANSSPISPNPSQDRQRAEQKPLGYLVKSMPTPDQADPGPSVAATNDLAGAQERIQQATDAAAANGATIDVAILDRSTGQLFTNGNTQMIATASVAKLFIADDLLAQEAQGRTTLAPDDRQAIDVMLRSSDDGAAERFWRRDGGSAIITGIAARYGLSATEPPNDGHWWNTLTTASDLVRYYDMLLSGTGGLPQDQASIILDDLAHSTPSGTDGYPQRFGIPDGLYAETVAVKQGWMCCVGPSWVHLSTGVIGPDRRYIMVIESQQAADDATARDTITRAVKTIFPEGRV